MTIQEIDRARVWHPYTQMQTAPPPVPIVRAEGVYLYTEDGRRILDGISSWWVNIHGHGHPRLNEALARQARELEHVMFAGFTHRPAAELADRLVALLPRGLTRIFYSDNGSTAVEVALKMSFQYWQNVGQPQRREFIALDHAYHGDTVGAMSASAESPFTAPFQRLLFPVERAHAPYCFRCPVGCDRATCSIDCLRRLESILASRGDSIAAVLIEPMLQAAGGMIVWPVEFLTGVRQLCDRYRVLMIADEVLTGFGRTGKMFACEHGPVRPDIACLSKALTGGYLPLGVTAATEEIYASFLSNDRLKTFFHGHSFTANPLACAVALASLDLLIEDRSMDRVARLEALLRSRFTALRSRPVVADARILGGVAALELRAGQGGYLEPIGARLAAEFLSRGLLLRPLGNILYFMPPYVITDAEAHWAIDQIEEVLAGTRGD
ncbi:MAG TPA: adenosylmethionine--8-amino-7-oxononanoate transaminase [Bryobacteraceae bacterium]|jgi:adenosylmethionine-8-amino-7-oxononanoate aminotransferase|nr:adenosylmethionine--8-amino-7-oxononanoate transaminase [Bryobacteraceae bacterium]